MQNLSGSSWLVKPTEAYITHFKSESTDLEPVEPGSKEMVHVGSSEIMHRWIDFYEHVLQKPCTIAARHFKEDLVKGKRELAKGTHKGYSLAKFKGDRRRKENNEECYAIGIDIDHTDKKWNQVVEAVAQMRKAALLHTTGSNGCGGKFSYRIIVPLDKPCRDKENFKRRNLLLAAWLENFGLIADQAPIGDTARFWYWPCVSSMSSEPYACAYFDGELVTTQFSKQVAVKHFEPPGTSVLMNRTEGSANIGTRFIDAQLEPYKNMGNNRGRWLARKFYWWGGLYSGGEWAMTPQQVHDYSLAEVNKNIGRAAQRESEFFWRQWNIGIQKPCKLDRSKDADMRGNSMVEPKKKDKKDNYEFPWEDQLLRDSHNKVRSRTQTNPEIIVNHHSAFKGIFRLEEGGDQLMVFGPVPGMEPTGIYPHGLLNADQTKVQMWIERNYDFSPPLTQVLPALESLALKNKYHELKDKLLSFKVTRDDVLSTWLVDVFGAEDTPYVRAVSRKVMIGAARRVFHPGCKVDTMMVLEGIQGAKKSSAIKLLALEDKYFNETLPDITDNKALAMAMRGRLIGEVQELHKFYNSDPEGVKASLSTCVDTLRKLYRDGWSDFRRNWILIGTTNMSQYLRDATGGRRIWPIECRRINLEKLKEIREELWAQAISVIDLYDVCKGEQHWMEEELEELAKEVQESRFEPDMWDGIITERLKKHQSVNRDVGLALTVIAKEWLQIPFDRMDPRVKTRIGKIMTHARWKLYRESADEHGHRPWKYYHESHPKVRK